MGFFDRIFGGPAVPPPGSRLIWMGHGLATVGERCQLEDGRAAVCLIVEGAGTEAVALAALGQISRPPLSAAEARSMVRRLAEPGAPALDDLFDVRLDLVTATRFEDQVEVAWRVLSHGPWAEEEGVALWELVHQAVLEPIARTQGLNARALTQDLREALGLPVPVDPPSTRGRFEVGADLCVCGGDGQEILLPAVPGEWSVRTRGAALVAAHRSVESVQEPAVVAELAAGEVSLGGCSLRLSGPVWVLAADHDGGDVCLVEVVGATLGGEV